MENKRLPAQEYYLSQNKVAFRQLYYATKLIKKPIDLKITPIFQYLLMFILIIASERNYCAEISIQNEYFTISNFDKENMRYCRSNDDYQNRKIALWFTNDINLKIANKAHHLAGNMQHIADMRWNLKPTIIVPEYYKFIRSYTAGFFESGKDRERDFREMADLLKRYRELDKVDMNALREGGLTNPNFDEDCRRRRNNFYIEIEEAERKFKKYRKQRKLNFWDSWKYSTKRHGFQNITSFNIYYLNAVSFNDDVVIYYP